MQKKYTIRNRQITKTFDSAPISGFYWDDDEGQPPMTSSADRPTEVRSGTRRKDMVEIFKDKFVVLFCNGFEQ